MNNRNNPSKIYLLNYTYNKQQRQMRKFESKYENGGVIIKKLNEIQNQKGTAMLLVGHF